MIADVVMPGINGHEVVERIARDRGDAKVLFLSGYSEHATVREEVLEAGRQFLQKPFTTDTLMHTVREVLDAAKAKAAESGS